jgi:acetylglutamate kinase
MNRRLLIKIGGRAFEKEAGFRELAQAIKAVPGIETIIVHGGGAEISKALQDHGRETLFIDGIRVTQAEDMRILSGTINARIASWLTDSGVSCQRMSGKTQQLFVVEPMTRDGRQYGFVGDIKQVNGEGLLRALKQGRVPVISPISADENHRSFNVNADSAAAALAAEIDCMGCHRRRYCLPDPFRTGGSGTHRRWHHQGRHGSENDIGIRSTDKRRSCRLHHSVGRNSYPARYCRW